MQGLLIWFSEIPWSVILEHSKSFALPLAGVYVAHKFGSIQASIGKRQAETAALSMETARNKLRLDLFEKRFAVFESANLVISKVRRKGRLDAEDRDIYWNQIQTATWLFDKEVVHLLSNEIFGAIYDLVEVTENIEEEADPVEKKKLNQRIMKYTTVFHVLECNLHEAMAPYLRFTEPINGYKSKPIDLETLLKGFEDDKNDSK